MGLHACAEGVCGRTATCCRPEACSPALEVEQYQGSTLLAVSFHIDNQPLTEVCATAAPGDAQGVPQIKMGGQHLQFSAHL